MNILMMQDLEENVKIVEMDLGEYRPATRGRNSYSQTQATAEAEEYSLESSPQCYSAAVSKADHARLPFSYPKAESLYNDCPNYMANTQSSRAKVRSHSAPKQRPPEAPLMVLDRRRPSIEGRNVPRAVRMQRSSSHYPWSVKLDRSSVSLKDSECGSSSTVLTNTNYCRSLVGFEVTLVSLFYGLFFFNLYVQVYDEYWFNCFGFRCMEVDIELREI